jgi:iron(III) transport system substrate-binding protein
MTARISMALLAGLFCARLFAADEYLFQLAAPAQQTLIIYGTTDYDEIAPVMRDYQKVWPATEIRYTHFLTRELYARFLREADSSGGSPADLVLSSAMDLQQKLVNDGYAQPYISAETSALQAWARWRYEAFGFTQEPVVLVYNTKQLPEKWVPHTRFDLMALLRDPPVRMMGRIGTYDVVGSALGYMLATQDARQSQVAGAMVDEFGDSDVVLESTTARLLERLESGELAMVYNALGSYAQARIDAGAPLRIVQLEDYTLVISHVAFIARKAPHRNAARNFLDYLLSQRGQTLLAQGAKSFSIREDVQNPFYSSASASRLVAPLRPISLGPGLLVYLDKLKSEQFINTWVGSIRKIGGGDSQR